MKDNFEKKIQSLFEHVPDVPFDEHGWELLEKHLRKEKSGKRNRFWLWLPILFGSIALFGMGYLLGTRGYSQYSTQEASLKNQEQLPNTDEEKEIPAVSPTSVIHDTIFKTIIRYEYVKIKQPTSPAVVAPLVFSSLANPFGEQSFNLPFSNRRRTLLSRNFEATTLLDLNGEVDTKPALARAVDTISKKSPLFIQYENEEVLSQSVQKYDRKPSGNLFKDLVPRSFSIGIITGSFQNLEVKSPEGKQDNLLVGFRAKLDYTSRWSAIVGVELLRNNYDVYTDRLAIPDLLFRLPTVNPISAGDRLHEIQGRFRYLQIPIGAQYALPLGRQWELYFGAGGTFRKTQTSTLIYDYISNTNEYEIPKSNLIPTSFKLKSLWGEAGLRYYVGNRWALEGAFGGQTDWKGKFYKHESLQYLKWHLGISLNW